MEVASHLTEKGQRDYQYVQLAVEKGDQQAYGKLMNFYRDSIYFMMLKMTNNEADAEDLTIEAFGKAFNKLHQYSPDHAFSTWLFKIASNNCIDFIRKKRKRHSTMQDINDSEYLDDITGNMPSDEADPEEGLMKKQKKEMLRGIVDKLKPHYRTLVEMRYFDELSYEEIATELDLPLGTVKAKLFRARNLLLNIIKKSSEQF